MAGSNPQQNTRANGARSSNERSDNGNNSHGKSSQPNNQPPKPKKHKPEPKSKPWGYIYIMAMRILPFAIPIVVLMCFTLILNLPMPLKSPKGRDDDVLLHLKLAHESILAEDWVQALAHIENAEKAWAMVIPRIQIGVQKDDIGNLTLSLVRLKASTQCMDKPGCLRELAESFLYWDEIGK
ncbi:MAG TPA: hypothetical protein GX529_04065 [Firmicutes bacterium]|nr:hypothetical protein [Candidatus Fermentithermobacillaceae bacterium]